MQQYFVPPSSNPCTFFFIHPLIFSFSCLLTQCLFKFLISLSSLHLITFFARNSPVCIYPLATHNFFCRLGISLHFKAIRHSFPHHSPQPLNPQSHSGCPTLPHSYYNKLCSFPYHIPLKFANMRLWQWCITLQITKFLDHFRPLIIINEIRCYDVTFTQVQFLRLPTFWIFMSVHKSFIYIMTRWRSVILCCYIEIDGVRLCWPSSENCSFVTNPIDGSLQLQTQ